MSIHGGVSRGRRREITEEFTHNPDVRVLLATDAAGEGLNLQAAHLMVNYDLPWNPNRLEQRFGRIHRIGQTEVCRLWNLVAGTRAGAVFKRLLAKVEEQRQAYGGKVFDVLGAAFDNVPLRQLLMDAVQYGEQPEVRARMEQVIDERVSEGLRELLEERALAHDTMTTASVAELRRQMEARASPAVAPLHQDAFAQAFKRLGGRMSRREAGRFEIAHVPIEVREAARGPVATRYDRVTFDLDQVAGSGPDRAELIAPGHPLHDAVLDLALARFGSALEDGTVLISTAVTSPAVLVGVVEEVADATGESIAKRFGYAFVGEDGAVRDAGPAPYLDCVVAPDPAAAVADHPWATRAEQAGRDWLVAQRLPEVLAATAERRGREVERMRTQVTQRMNQEINRLATEALTARDKEQRGVRVREGSESLTRKRLELEQRLVSRLAVLDRQAQLATRLPSIVAAALVLPFVGHVEEVPATSPMRAVETQEVERRGVDAVLAAERALGRVPTEMPHNNKGYDVRSVRGDDPTIFLEVKARIEGAEDFFVTHSEVRHGQNSVPHYRLALVRVDPARSRARRGALHRRSVQGHVDG